MSNTPSVTVHYAQAILQAAERLALPLPAELREPSREARIPLARQDELWEAFCAVAGDPLIGLRLGHALQVGHLERFNAAARNVAIPGIGRGFPTGRSMSEVE